MVGLRLNCTRHTKFMASLRLNCTRHTVRVIFLITSGLSVIYTSLFVYSVYDNVSNIYSYDQYIIEKRGLWTYHESHDNDPIIFSKIINTLASYWNNDDYRDFIIYIPEDQQAFWQNSNGYNDRRFWVPFLIPALSGLPAFRGYDHNIMNEQKVFNWRPKGSYGYQVYYSGDSLLPCEKDVYVGIITIRESSGVIGSIVDYCNEQE